jgi:hypothetical protein
MESLVEPIRITITVLVILTAIAMTSALRDAGLRVPRVALVWMITAMAVAAFFSHVTRSLPSPVMVPLGASLGIALGLAAQRSRSFTAAFAKLDDRAWRMLVLTRAVFGALILAAAAVHLFPLAFAIPAGIGDLVAGMLALAAPGSLATDGPRGVRLFVYAVGMLDFIQVIALIITVLVPWLAVTNTVGISLLLPWVGVPLLATLNLFGLRFALAR